LYEPNRKTVDAVDSKPVRILKTIKRESDFDLLQVTDSEPLALYANEASGKHAKCTRLEGLTVVMAVKLL